MNFWRVEAATPKVVVADIEANKKEILRMARAANRRGVKILVFPELSLTGYSCGDLFLQQNFREKALEAVQQLAKELPKDMMVAVGAPLATTAGSLYNCAVCYHGGDIVGITSKSYLPNYGEFHEKRYFRSGLEDTAEDFVLDNSNPIFNQLLELKDEVTGESVTVGVEICEDLWAPIPPSNTLALAGAEILLNLAACTERRMDRNFREDLVRMQSSRLKAAYVLAAAGPGESTTDTVCAGDSIICENGTLLKRAEAFPKESAAISCDIDVDALRYARASTTSFLDGPGLNAAGTGIAGYIPRMTLPIQKRDGKILRPVKAHPFLPDSDEDGLHILQTQAVGLAHRMEHIHCDTAVLGVSGGLDSTLALLVCCEAFDRLGLPRKNIHGLTMPGLGTSKTTKDLATDLMKALKITTKTIDISEATKQHLADIGHNLKKTDVVFENAQARERTQIVMDYANKVGGLAVGTGDLSEIALGWCTYNGDHMSMYGVNGSIPKTLVRHLVALYGERIGGKAGSILREIVGIPISPELLPADQKGNIAQKTEDIIGPYELHDFFLYHMMVHGATPAKIYALAKIAFAKGGENEGNGGNSYTPSTIKKWLVLFYKRFFASQFKRSCMPDGPKAGPVSLSPRGGWMMPSDGAGTLWIKEAENL